MSKYRINKVKHVSNAQRYGYLRKVGVIVETDEAGQGYVLSGEDLDNYVDEELWRAAHPGQEPIREFE